MKRHYCITFAFLTLIGISVHATFNGYRTIDCTGDFLIAASWIDLVKQDGQEGPDGEIWDFESYIELPEIEDCKTFSTANSIIGNKIILPPDDYAPVVFLPTPFPRPVLWADFDEETNAVLLDSWLSETVDHEVISNIILTRFKNKQWSTEIPAEYRVLPVINTENLGRLAEIVFKEQPWDINVYSGNIKRVGDLKKIPPEHLAIYAQMEEHIHGLQGLADYLKDGKGHTIADHIAAEVEAKHIIQFIIWPILYGTLPPLLIDPEGVANIPEEYWENRERFQELIDIINDPTKTDEEVQDEMDDYQDLKDYFLELNERLQIGSIVNENYEHKTE